MNEIRFKVIPAYKDEDVVKRIEQIVTGTGMVIEQDHGYKWMLGGSNDWFMDKDQKTDELILAYRYGGGLNTPRMQALRTVILWRLGLGIE